MSEFLKRNLAAIVLIAILALAVYIGRPMMMPLVCIVAMLILYELYNTVGGRPAVIGYIGAVFMLGSFFLKFSFEGVLLTVTVYYIVVFVLTKIDLSDIAIVAFSMIYVVIPAYFALVILDVFGVKYLLLTVIIPIVTDSFAYIVGKLFGRHKMAPEISPKKTWEGAIGGLVFAMAATALYSYYVLGRPVLDSIVFGAVLSAISQMGDLSASKIKREKGIKDYGNIIPGHGGLLDRFDSYLLVFTSFYIAITWIIPRFSLWGF